MFDFVCVVVCNTSIISVQLRDKICKFFFHEIIISVMEQEAHLMENLDEHEVLTNSLNLFQYQLKTRWPSG